jgi:hypothetical protein
MVGVRGGTRVTAASIPQPTSRCIHEGVSEPTPPGLLAGIFRDR